MSKLLENVSTLYMDSNDKIGDEGYWKAYKNCWNIFLTFG